MENYRIILSLTLIVLASIIYTKWQEYSLPVTKEALATEQHQPATNKTVSDNVNDVPEVVNKPEIITSNNIEVDETIVSAETDEFKIRFSNIGGTVVATLLKEYYKSEKNKNDKYQLIGGDSGLKKVQSGLLGSMSNLPNHKSKFRFEKVSYLLSEKDSLEVPFIWEDEDIRVLKKYILHKGSYTIDLVYSIENKKDKEINVKTYWQVLHHEINNNSAFMNAYSGGAYFSEDLKYNEVTYDELNKNQLNISTGVGWFSYVTHYFIGGVIPESKNNFYAKKITSKSYLIGSHTPDIIIAPKSIQEVKAKLWLGPKLQNQLETVAPGLELTADYGRLTFIAKPIFWLLNNIHMVVGNWGWAIVLLTLLIKLAFYRLSAASYRSMANMRKLAPQMQALKERYGEDKEKFNKAMMEFYQKEKINPLGGCLPIAVQIPVFISLYWVLMETVELRGAPFIFWINNLSAEDPYFVLPVIMGISMFVQQKLNPQPTDPMQAKIMQALPFVFTAFFLFFPAGLVLYWVVNNILSILQQWRITSVIEKSKI